MSSIFVPVRIEYGSGSSSMVGSEFKTLKCQKVLVITDQGIVKSGLIERIIESLENVGISHVLYDQVKPDPDEECVTSARNLFFDENCDGILAVGGGSSIDCAKGAAILATNPEPLMNYAGPDKIKNPLPALIAIPTTCGTGSEVTNVTVITNENHFKAPFISTHLVPKVAILDPDLLYTLPPHLVAATGMDALTHAIEALTNKLDNWYADVCAIQAIRDIKQYIRPAAAGGDKIALGKMLYASTLAGISFTISRLGLVHAMSHPVSSFAGIPHGIANAVLLPYVMSFNLVGNPEAYAKVARELGVPELKSLVKTAEAGVMEIIRLNHQLGIPKSFKELGMKEAYIPLMIEDTFKSGNIAINPRRVSKKDVEMIYLLSLKGDSPLLLLEGVIA
jgi:alcohol dehydrogenase class IV